MGFFRAGQSHAAFGSQNPRALAKVRQHSGLIFALSGLLSPNGAVRLTLENRQPDENQGGVRHGKCALA
jgi:hypothetical protein